jgi:hypothetical protein
LIGCSQRSPFWARSSTRSRESGASSTTTLFQNGRSDRTQGNPANRVPASHTTYPTQQSSSCQSNPPPERFIAIAYTRDMTRLADTNQHRKAGSTPWNNIASTNTHSQVESTKYTTFHGSARTYRQSANSLLPFVGRPRTVERLGGDVDITSTGRRPPDPASREM